MEDPEFHNSIKKKVKTGWSRVADSPLFSEVKESFIVVSEFTKQVAVENYAIIVDSVEELRKKSTDSNDFNTP